MKKYLVLIIASIFAILAAPTASAFIDSYTISRDKLPEAAREMLDTYFPKAKVSMIKVDRHLLKRTDYDVRLTNGFSIEFSNKGQWRSVVNNKNKEVPEEIVPATIRRYISKNHPETCITGIVKRSGGHDITLSDGTSHRFNLLHQYKGAISSEEALTGEDFDDSDE